MHKFAELNSERAALLFADYCVANGWQVEAVIGKSPVAELYVAEDVLPVVQREFERFLQQPEHPRYQQAAWQLSKEHTTTAPGKISAELWSGWLRHTPVTTIITVLCLAVYLWQQLDWRTPLYLFQLSDPAQLWRWFTPALLHFSLTHIVFNLMWWVYLGRNLEQQLGSLILLNISLSIAFLSNAAQYFLVSGNFGGLSGVVYGLFGYCWLVGKLRPEQGIYINNGLAGFLLLWLVLGFLDVLWVSMANWAHLAGLLAGLSWAYIWHKSQR